MSVKPLCRLIICLNLILLFALPCTTYAYTIDDSKESDELIFHDALLVFLDDPINSAVAKFYSETLTESPLVYPYEIKILNLKRVEAFRSFSFEVTVEVDPVVGPHISVGKDQLTLSISPIVPHYVKVIHYKHLFTETLPPSW